MVSTMNGIANAQSSVPRLTQDDSNVPYCNADKLPEHCFDQISCHCSHLVELELCEVYEFQLIDVRGETKNVFIVFLPSSSGELKYLRVFLTIQILKQAASATRSICMGMDFK